MMDFDTKINLGVAGIFIGSALRNRHERFNREWPQREDHRPPAPETKIQLPQEERDALYLKAMRERVREAVAHPQGGMLDKAVRSSAFEHSPSESMKINLEGRKGPSDAVRYESVLPEGAAALMAITPQEYQNIVREEYAIMGKTVVQVMSENPSQFLNEHVDYYIQQTLDMDARINPDMPSHRADILAEFGTTEEHLADWKNKGFANSFNEELANWHKDERKCSASTDFSRAASDNVEVYSKLKMLSLMNGVDIKDKETLAQKGINVEALSNFNADFEKLKESTESPTMARAKGLIGMSNGCN